MKKEDLFDEKATEANLNMNAKFNASNVEGSTKGLPEAVRANLQIQNEFYGDDKNGIDVPATYISSNTPPIKINETDD